MRKITLVLTAALVVLGLSIFADAQTSRKSVSGAEVTGTFKRNFQGKFKKMSNDIQIQALGGGQLRVVFSLIYPYTTQTGETSANIGNIDSVIPIVGDTAVYRSTEFGDCTITLKFTKPGTLVVTQDGDSPACGFGHNVFAAGTYRKVSSKRPVFTVFE